MTAYIIRRLLQMIPLIFGVTFLTFALINLIPGSPGGAAARQSEDPSRGGNRAGASARARQTLAGALRAVAGRSRPGRPGGLPLQPPAGRRPHLGGDPQHAAAGGPGSDAGAPDRGAAGGLLGGETRHPVRSLGERWRGRHVRHARLLAGVAAGDPLCAQVPGMGAAVVARRRHGRSPRRRRIPGPGRASHLAGAGAGHGPDRLLVGVLPLVDAGDAEPGLRAHRQGEGACRAGPSSTSTPSRTRSCR